MCDVYSGKNSDVETNSEPALLLDLARLPSNSYKDVQIIKRQCGINE